MDDMRLDLLHYEMQQISQEGFSEIKASIVTRFKNLVNYMSSVKDSLLKSKKQLEVDTSQSPSDNKDGIPHVANFANNQKVNYKLEKVPYLSFKNETVFIPVGMVSKWIDYIETLEVGVDIGSSVLNGVLSPVNVKTSMLLGNPDSLRSASGIPGPDVLNLERPITDYKKRMGKIFDSRKNFTTAPYTEAFSRHKEWIDVCSKLEAISSKEKQIQNKDLIKATEEISKTIDLLIMKINKSNGGMSMAEHVVSELSEMLYDAARAVEFVGAYKTMLMTAVNVMAMNQRVMDARVEG